MVAHLPAGCRLTAIFDVSVFSVFFRENRTLTWPQSCHSGTVLDLPYIVSVESVLYLPLSLSSLPGIDARRSI